MTHFEWPVGSPTRGQICWRKSDNMLSDLKIVESIVKSKSDNMLSDFHGNPTVCCRIWGAHSKWVGAREGRPPSQGASPLSSLKPLTKNHETQFYSKWVNSKWVRVSPISASCSWPTVQSYRQSSLPVRGPRFSRLLEDALQCTLDTDTALAASLTEGAR